MDRNHCIDVIARDLVTSPGPGDLGDMHEDYPDISEHDWTAIVDRAYQILDDLAPDPRNSRTANQILAAAATVSKSGDTHPLAQAIAYTQAHYTEQNIPSRDPRRRLGRLFATAGEATYASIHSRTLHRLAYVAYQAACWAAETGGQQPGGPTVWDQIRAEYDRAHHKHNGLTPLSPALSDTFKAAILLEEVGEVARACTPDAHTDTGHAGNLTDELVQVATMACAWAQCILNKEGE